MVTIRSIISTAALNSLLLFTSPAESASAPSTYTTKAPVITTKAPVITTKAPVITTKAPVITTKAPVITTKAPSTTTTTAAPVTTTVAPIITTSAPSTTTSTPASLTAEADSPPSRCCFNDGDLISLRADTNLFMGRCDGCVPGGAYQDSAFVHVSDPKDAPWAQWKVFNTLDGKLVLQADTGKFLGRCNNCAPGAAYPDEAFVHVQDWNTSPWAQWVCVDAGNGKIALQADSGRYLARCEGCIPRAYPNTAFVHATSVSEPYAQWAVVSKNPSAGLCS
ncbi:hypothetical protein B5M09_010155 [Aphanomyces astaci]|uniref:Ricin B lectin domain-containing protein n=1 Tax=Aphanomyces astaci TaxID=112090 RepID=A0A3R7YEF9_APHAT|nr:hypothetical protein B5M09_010155 [Aphanomyces astaci]